MILSHHWHQAIGGKTHLFEPLVRSHGQKLSEASVIVKNPCRALSCLIPRRLRPGREVRLNPRVPTRPAPLLVLVLGLAAQPGIGFPTLLGQWHAATYVERLPGFTDPSGRLSYTRCDLRCAIDHLVPGPYPLRPDSTSGDGHTVRGTLRGGSGKHLRVVQPAGAGGAALGLTTGNSTQVAPRLAVVRI